MTLCYLVLNVKKKIGNEKGLYKMKKNELLSNAKKYNFEVLKEVKDLSGNTFISLYHNKITDFIFIFRNQKDNNFFLIGSYPLKKANNLIDRFKASK